MTQIHKNDNDTIAIVSKRSMRSGLRNNWENQLFQTNRRLSYRSSRLKTQTVGLGDETSRNSRTGCTPCLDGYESVVSGDRDSKAFESRISVTIYTAKQVDGCKTMWREYIAASDTGLSSK